MYKKYCSAFIMIPSVNLIVAMNKKGVIGEQNKLPWALPNDLRHFKETTRNHTVIMGRNTYLSIGKALPHRHNIVLSRQSNWQAHNCLHATNLSSALTISVTFAPCKVFIIGGAQIYREALPLVSTIYLTLVHIEKDGDSYFPTTWNDLLTNWRYCYLAAFVLWCVCRSLEGTY